MLKVNGYDVEFQNLPECLDSSKHPTQDFILKWIQQILKGTAPKDDDKFCIDDLTTLLQAAGFTDVQRDEDFTYSVTYKGERYIGLCLVPVDTLFCCGEKKK